MPLEGFSAQNNLGEGFPMVSTGGTEALCVKLTAESEAAESCDSAGKSQGCGVMEA